MFVCVCGCIRIGTVYVRSYVLAYQSSCMMCLRMYVHAYVRKCVHVYVRSCVYTCGCRQLKKGITSIVRINNYMVDLRARSVGKMNEKHNVLQQ